MATGSPVSLGLTYLVFAIPRSVVRLFGGVYVDRFDRKRVMLFTEVSRALLFAAIGAAAFLGTASLPLVYSVSFSVGTLGALFDLSSDTLVPMIVEKPGLLRANSVFTSVFQVDNIVGPAAAGLVIAFFGTSTPLFVDSASFAVLVIFLLLMKVPRPGGPPPVVKATEEKRRGWVREFREGLSFFRDRRELIWLAGMIGTINFGLGAFWNVYSLIFAKDVLLAGSLGWGLISAFSALGIFATSVLIAKRGEIRRRRLSVVSSFIIMGVLITLLPITSNLPEALAAIFGFGLAVPFTDTVAATYYQETVPRELMGRVFGVRHFINYVAVPVSIAFGIFAVTTFGVVTAMLISGVLVLGMGVLSIFARSLAGLDSRTR